MKYKPLSLTAIKKGKFTENYSAYTKNTGV